MTDRSPRVVKQKDSEAELSDPVTIDRKEFNKLIEDANALVGLLEKNFVVLTSKLKTASSR